MKRSQRRDGLLDMSAAICREVSMFNAHSRRKARLCKHNDAIMELLDNDFEEHHL